MTDPLATYLDDHMAGAALAIDLLRAMKDRHENESMSKFATTLLIEVEKDEDTLRNLAKKVGSASNILKETAAWITEKASRAKLRASTNGTFGDFETLEFLALGIQGKLCLWRALQWISKSDARLYGLAFDKLISRAQAQYDSVEERRLLLATSALKPEQS